MYAFFGISGFLIVRSWQLDPRLVPFLAKRCLRILPALVVMLLVVVVLLGPIVSVLPIAQYFGDADTWQYLFRNMVFLFTQELPGVFLDAPVGRDVNGSIHTLNPEVIAYLAVAVFGLVGVLRWWWFPLALAGALVILPHQSFLPWPDDIFWWQAFAVGASLYVARDRVPWHWGVALVAVVAWLAAPQALQGDMAVLVIPYVAIFTAYHGPRALRSLAARGDYSYGIYIYAWPIAQTIVTAWGPSGTPAIVIAISLPLTYAAAVLSWVIVERPALALKKRLPTTSAEPRTSSGSSVTSVRLGNRAVHDLGQAAGAAAPSEARQSIRP